MSETILVLTNMPDEAAAHELARALIDLRLAACVNVLAPCRSFYRWQDTVEDEPEVPVLIKTVRSRYDALERAILERHPYELPEIIAVSIESGLPGYLAWVGTETNPVEPA